MNNGSVMTQAPLEKRINSQYHLQAQPYVQNPDNFNLLSIQLQNMCVRVCKRV